MASSVTTTQSLTCPECGKEFRGTRASQSLGGHRWRSHGVRSEEALRREKLGQAPKKGRGKSEPQASPAPQAAAASTRVTRDGYAANVRASLRELMTPLHDQLAEIDARLVTIERETRELREARREISSVLSKLDPTTRSKSATTTQSSSRADSNALRAQRQLAEKVATVEELITSDARWQDGFTSNQIADALSPYVPRGLSTKSARRVLDELRERGIVRADRVVKGGGMQFKLVTNGGSDEQQAT